MNTNLKTTSPNLFLPINDVVAEQIEQQNMNIQHSFESVHLKMGGVIKYFNCCGSLFKGYLLSNLRFILKKRL
jgi:hypothetical protein